MNRGRGAIHDGIWHSTLHVVGDHLSMDVVLDDATFARRDEAIREQIGGVVKAGGFERLHSVSRARRGAANLMCRVHKHTSTHTHTLTRMHARTRKHVSILEN